MLTLRILELIDSCRNENVGVPRQRTSAIHRTHAQLRMRLDRIMAAIVLR